MLTRRHGCIYPCALHEQVLDDHDSLGQWKLRVAGLHGVASYLANRPELVGIGTDPGKCSVRRVFGM